MSRYAGSSNYSPLATFGSNVKNRNPLEYCIPGVVSEFQTGTLGALYGPYSDKCQRLTGQHCAKSWDNLCEVLSGDQNKSYPNQVKNSMYPEVIPLGDISAGQNLIRNAGFYKYCKVPETCKKYQPFDPTNPDSPLIWYSTDGSTYSKSCFPICTIDYNSIDSDIVMSKMLANPEACMDIFLNIWYTAKASGKLGELLKTNVGKFMRRYPNVFN